MVIHQHEKKSGIAPALSAVTLPAHQQQRRHEQVHHRIHVEVDDKLESHLPLRFLSVGADRASSNVRAFVQAAKGVKVRGTITPTDLL